MFKDTILSLVLLSWTVTAMSLEIDQRTEGVWWLNGEIVSGDYEKFLYTAKSAGALPDWVFLNSNGGDIIDAMKLGELFRKSLITTNARVQCDSACFIMWVGGVQRFTSDPIGMHRPFYDRKYFSELSADVAETEYKKLQTLTEKYLQRMDVPQHVIDTMITVDSSEMLKVSPESIE